MGRQVVRVSVALIGALALAGCAANAEPVASASPTSTASSVDREACEASNDVRTIVANADVGVSDGRMATQEQQGWYRVAARVLDRVQTSGDGAVSDAIAALKEAAPAEAPGAMGTVAIGSDEWNSGLQLLSDACDDVGVEAAIMMFTGG
ncbi:MAG: hypothetical protein JWQ43_113 [Glaciihabitans sp.]|nr:hypothetical protein [Glaciihabitans sp.]